MIKIFLIFFSYLLGSIPFGYIFTKIFAKKNILEVGWRKTSGSNVFRYIGFWPGLLTGFCDIGKGFLVIWLAKNFGLFPKDQVICGVAAILGHNWPIFLKFAGGRGVGTFIGAFLALSPNILAISLIPFFLLAIIWNASIGTILFLVSALFLSVYFNQLETAGFFVLLSLFPIFIKRLSPIDELSWEKKELIRNRLIFDNDQLCLDLRIKRIIKRLTPH